MKKSDSLLEEYNRVGESIRELEDRRIRLKKEYEEALVEELAETFDGAQKGVADKWVIFTATSERTEVAKHVFETREEAVEAAKAGLYPGFGRKDAFHYPEKCVMRVHEAREMERLFERSGVMGDCGYTADELAQHPEDDCWMWVIRVYNTHRYGRKTYIE